jgi:hypothetical protein
MAANVRLQLAGIQNDRPMQSGICYVPEKIELDSGNILYLGGTLKEVRPGVGMLARFVDLHHQRDEEILKYAKKWGVLGICKHSLPCSHTQFAYSILAPRHKNAEWCMPRAVPGRKHWYADPIEVWRLLSKQMATFQQLGAELNQDRPGDETVWRILPGNLASRPWRSVSSARKFLALLLNLWLEIGQVRPVIDWSTEKAGWQLSFNAVSIPNLFGFLAFNLVLSISRRELAFCSSCRKSYPPDRRPNPSRRNYCETCGKKAAQRDASRAYRLRKRQPSIG